MWTEDGIAMMWTEDGIAMDVDGGWNSNGCEVEWRAAIGRRDQPSSSPCTLSSQLGYQTETRRRPDGDQTGDQTEISATHTDPRPQTAAGQDDVPLEPPEHRTPNPEPRTPSRPNPEPRTPPGPEQSTSQEYIAAVHRQSTKQARAPSRLTSHQSHLCARRGKRRFRASGAGGVAQNV